MKKINILKENYEFNRIIDKYRAKKYKNFVIYIEYDTNDHYKFGISVSKKIGNAVTRNKFKRQIRSIIDKKRYENNFKCIIILRRGVLNQNFESMQKELFNILNDLNIIKGETNEK